MRTRALFTNSGLTTNIGLIINLSYYHQTTLYVTGC